jgi:tetratricopeptide (TPR) repeat protein
LPLTALDETPNDSGLLGQLAASYDGLAESCKQLDRLDCAMEYYRQAVQIRSTELAQAPGDTRFAMLLSYHLIDLAWVEHRAGAQSQAIADEERALALQRGIAAADAGNLMARLETAKTLVTRGLIYRDGGDSARAIASLREAIGILESGLERDPDNESTVFHLAWSNAELGEIHRHLALTHRHGAAVVDSEWRNAAACFERSNQYLQGLKLGGKLMGILDDRNLREDVPKKLAECRRLL